MPFYVIEPSLRDEGGHHFEFAATIAANSGSPPEDLVIVAHSSCKASNAGAARIIPWFFDHIHQDIKRPPYGLSNFIHFNRSIYRDLQRLAKRFRFKSSDMLVFPTIPRTSFGVSCAGQKA